MFGFNVQFCFDICLSRSSSPFKNTVEKLKEGQVRSMLRSNEKKKCFTGQKTAETTRPQIMHDFRITPYINNIVHTAFVQRKQKAEQY